MRDIRGDLQDRASFLEEQISAAQAQFEKRLEQMTREHQAKIEDLQSELEAVTTLMEGEYRRVGNAPVAEERRQPSPRAEAEMDRRPAVEPRPEAYRRPHLAETEPERRPVAEAEPPRRHDREPEHYRRPVEADYPRGPEQEIYRQPARAQSQAEAAPQQRPSREPEQFRRPHIAEADAPRRPAPVRVHERAHEGEQEPRAAAPQVYRRAPLAAAPEGEREQRAPAARAPQQQAQQPPLADFLIRKLSEMGAMTLDELCQVAVQDGYFADGESADRGVHVTLMNVVKAGFIRQQPNGTYAPATVMDTIRLRRAI